MGVMRLGYVHVRVTDLAEAKKHYEDTLGLYQTLEQGNKAYYKGWDEWDHHSVVLEEGGVGIVKAGFKVRYADDLDRFETAAHKFGVTVERFSKGENAEVGEGVRFRIPMGHTIELYNDMTYVGTEVGTFCPMSHPRHLKGIGAHISTTRSSRVRTSPPRRSSSSTCWASPRSSAWSPIRATVPRSSPRG